MSQLTYYAGIDIGASNIKYGLVDSTGKVIYRDLKPSQVAKGAMPLLHMVTNIAENLLLRAAEDELQIKWLGVGTPGVVDIKTGTVIGISPNIPDWVGTELGPHLKEHLNLPVYVDNDANSMALGELRFGAGRRFNNILCVTVGTGIGGAVIINKELWRGSNFTAGELGHIVIDYNGKKCDCGNSGCLEKYCTGPVMIKLAIEKLKNGMTETMNEILSGDIENLNIKKLFTGAKKGDELALSIIEQSAKILGAGLSGIVNLLNPEAIIFGGGVIDGGAGYIEIVGAEIRRRSFPTATENLRIVKAELGNNAGFIGAGLLGEYKL